MRAVVRLLVLASLISTAQAQIPGETTYIGITANRFANDSNSFEVLLQRFQQTVDAGVTFINGNATWAELEPGIGRHELDGVRYLASIAEAHDLAVSYTLRVIDNVHRGVPQDLQGVAFNNPQMISRLLMLIDDIVPVLRKRTRWIILGYEVDPYFQNHPDEIDPFLTLYQIAAQRIRSLAPEMRVGVSLTFFGIDQLDSSLSRLNSELDFLALTYCPLNPDFSVVSPVVLPSDFARMKEVAAGRKVVFQEIAYPSSPLSDSSGLKQAMFYSLAFDQFRSDPATFEAANFMVLADLSDETAQAFADFYNVPLPYFKSTLQTLGMFDGTGQPKAAWDVITSNLLTMGKSMWSGPIYREVSIAPQLRR